MRTSNPGAHYFSIPSGSAAAFCRGMGGCAGGKNDRRRTRASGVGRRPDSAESLACRFCSPLGGAATGSGLDERSTPRRRTARVGDDGPRQPVSRVPSAVRAFGAIVIAYGLVTVYFFLRFAWRCRRLAFLRRGVAEAVFPVEVADFWMQCSKGFGIGEVSLATSSQIFGPVTLGISRPLVLLPISMVDVMPTGDLHTVITHEFAHIQRNDFFKNLMYELLALPVSYHPLFWLTRERMMESREMVCDEMAAAISGRDEYAHSLLRLASLLVKGTPGRTPHAIGIFDANTLERRLMRLTERRNEIRGWRRWGLRRHVRLWAQGPALRPWRWRCMWKR